MDELLGPKYQIFEINGDHVVLVKGDNTDLANSKLTQSTKPDVQLDTKYSDTPQKTFDDYTFQVYVGSLTIVGLFILFRMIQKNR